MKIKAYEFEHNGETNIYEIKPTNNDWFDLVCNDTLVAKLVSEEECRRVIWTYLVSIGKNIDYITDEDLEVVNV